VNLTVLLLVQGTVGMRHARRHEIWVPRISSDSFADRLSPLSASGQSHPNSLTPRAPRRQVSRREVPALASRDLLLSTPKGEDESSHARCAPAYRAVASDDDNIDALLVAAIVTQS
jgi:hypothetical protein